MTCHNFRNIITARNYLIGCETILDKIRHQLATISVCNSQSDWYELYDISQKIANRERPLSCQQVLTMCPFVNVTIFQAGMKYQGQCYVVVLQRQRAISSVNRLGFG